MLERSFVLGVDHHASSVDVRQCLSDLSVEELKQSLPVKELYVLSTCNRFEVYGVAPCQHSAMAAKQGLKDLFARKTQSKNIEAHVYEKSGEDMLRHGFNVASSLESMVLGEPQILGQMKQAYHEAKEQGALGSDLDKFFGATFRVGKRVRHETMLASEPVSVSSAAVRLAEEVFDGDFTQAKVVLIGAGEMCTAAARHMHRRGLSHVSVVNRTLERAINLADEVNAVAMPLSKMLMAIDSADIVISCVHGDEPLVTKQMVQTVVVNRAGKPLHFVDMAVPRNVATDVADIENVELYDMDAIGRMVETSVSKREAQVGQAVRIIDEEIEAFNRWSRERSHTHMIKHLRASFEKSRQEVLGENPSKEVEEATRLLMNKLLHQPTMMIKSDFVPPKAVEMALGLMFGLKCPRVEFLQIDEDSANTKECPFIDVMRQEGLEVAIAH